MKEEIEEWRAVVGFEGQYEVSNHGRVRSLDRLDFRGYRRKGKILSPGRQVAKAGYLQLTVHLRGPNGFRSYTVSRFVAEAFLPYPSGWVSGKGLQVDHRNGDGTCNLLSNLRWLTPSQNARAFSRPRSRSTKTSKYRGVYRPKANGRWMARATVNGKRGSFYIGSFETEEEAALAFNRVALENGYLPEALNVIEPADKNGALREALNIIQPTDENICAPQSPNIANPEDEEYAEAA